MKLLTKSEIETYKKEMKKFFPSKYFKLSIKVLDRRFIQVSILKSPVKYISDSSYLWELERAYSDSRDGKLVLHIFDELSRYVQEISSFIFSEKTKNCFDVSNWNISIKWGYSNMRYDFDYVDYITSVKTMKECREILDDIKNKISIRKKLLEM